MRVLDNVGHGFVPSTPFARRPYAGLCNSEGGLRLGDRCWHQFYDGVVQYTANQNCVQRPQSDSKKFDKPDLQLQIQRLEIMCWPKVRLTYFRFISQKVACQEDRKAISGSLGVLHGVTGVKVG